MGIKSWIARRGSIGNTARWAGNAYWSIKRRNPSAVIDDVMIELVSVRYSDAKMRPARDALSEIIDSGRMRGLAHLVTNILSIEASYQDNTQEDRFLFLEIITGELEKLKVPSFDIHDQERVF